MNLLISTEAMSSEYYSHGKLLLTGEYLVLHGAKALALPLKFGQKLIVRGQPSQKSLHWNSFYNNTLWFSAEFDSTNLNIISASDAQRAAYVQKLLIEVKGIANNSLSFNNLTLEHNLEFDPVWGFGSSSTLIANLAKWTNIDAFKLLKSISRGSGYDIACANATSPIIFQKNKDSIQISPVEFNPSFSEQLLFVYLGKKQATEASVLSFLNKKLEKSTVVDEISAITEEMQQCQNFDAFNLLLNEHERIVAEVTGLLPVKQERFSDFQGEIKSLGAWGGDFIMATLPDSEKNYVNYFHEKGFPVHFTFKDIKL